MKMQYVHPEYRGESERLARCPFCPPHLKPKVGMEKWRRNWHVKCYECGATGPRESRKDHAAGFWNRWLKEIG